MSQNMTTHKAIINVMELPSIAMAIETSFSKTFSNSLYMCYIVLIKSECLFNYEFPLNINLFQQFSTESIMGGGPIAKYFFLDQQLIYIFRIEE